MRFLTLCLVLAMSANLYARDKEDGSHEYNLVCKNYPSKEAPITFRLVGELTVYEDGSASLGGYRGVILQEPELEYMVVWNAKSDKDTVSEDPTYKPQKGKWADHLRFKMKAVVEDKSGGGPSPEFFVNPTPVSHKDKRFDNGVNTGIERTYNFHAGLQYSFHDQHGDRDQVICESQESIIDRK